MRDADAQEGEVVVSTAVDGAWAYEHRARVLSGVFAPTPGAAHAARAFVSARVPPACRPVAELLISEMATNALRHANTPFRVAVVAADTVRLEVWDRSVQVPRARPAAIDAESGRGLHILGMLSTAWGVDVVDGGKVVWCELPASGPRQLPRRR